MELNPTPQLQEDSGQEKSVFNPRFSSWPFFTKFPNQGQGTPLRKSPVQSIRATPVALVTLPSVVPDHPPCKRMWLMTWVHDQAISEISFQCKNKIFISFHFIDLPGHDLATLLKNYGHRELCNCNTWNAGLMESDRTINTRHGCPQHAMVRPNLPKLRQTFWSCVCCLVSFFVSVGSLLQSSSTLPENTVELHPQSKVYMLIFLGSHYNHMVLMCSLCMFKCMGGQISRRSLCRKSSGIVRNP